MYRLSGHNLKIYIRATVDILHSDFLRLDETDLRILKVLEEDARTPFTAIGEILGISDATVHIRVRKMTEEGVITGYRVEVDDDLLGRATGFVMIDVRPGSLRKVVEELLKDSRLLEVYEVHGPSDLIAKVRTDNIGGLREVTTRIRAVSDVTSTQIITSFKTWRRS
jgi:Lrp/AsnC family transcriptional regulator for asnA, asnC and gidA